jgi:hypothetical protein
MNPAATPQSNDRLGWQVNDTGTTAAIVSARFEFAGILVLSGMVADPLRAVRTPSGLSDISASSVKSFGSFREPHAALPRSSA